MGFNPFSKEPHFLPSFSRRKKKEEEEEEEEGKKRKKEGKGG